MSASVNAHWNGGYAPPPVYIPPAHAPAIAVEGDPFEVADTKTRYAARKFGEYVQQVNASGADERTKAAALESYSSTPAARDAVASVEAAKAHRDALAARPAEQQAAMTTAVDAGSQTAAQRQWERDRRLLDAQGNVGQMFTTAAKLISNAATPEQLNVHAEELPSYLASKGHPSSWVPDALAKAAPQLAEARSDASTAEVRMAKIAHNSRVVTNAYKAHRPVDDRLLLDPSA